MKNLVRAFICVVAGVLLLPGGLLAQSENRETRSRLKDALNPKWTVIIDYVNSFEHHRPGHSRGGDEPPPPEEECLDPHCINGHFELIGGVWDNIPGDPVIPGAPGLVFEVDLRMFPDGSQAAIQDAFNAWEARWTLRIRGKLRSRLS